MLIELVGSDGIGVTDADPVTLRDAQDVTVIVAVCEAVGEDEAPGVAVTTVDTLIWLEGVRCEDTEVETEGDAVDDSDDDTALDGVASPLNDAVNDGEEDTEPVGE